MKIVVLRGLPASGKSTWAKELVQRDRSYVRISKDDIRLAFGTYRPKDEKLVVKFESALIFEALSAGKNVIVDSTNLNPVHVERIRIAYPAHDVEVRDFPIDLDEAIARDLKRTNPVGESVIRSMHSKWLDFRPTLAPRGKPQAIIVDIDGTLACNDGHRSPYDWSKVYADTPIYPVVEMVNTFYSSSYNVILVSGRSDECREETERWLYDHGVNYGALFMRTAGDNRKDVIIKQEIFDEHIRDNIDVLFVVDDRQCVVDMWMDLGLHVLQSFAINEPRYKRF